ncbi:MAG: nitroreductase family protein [Candidatus Dormibacteraeota bacterium]|nr:nitroreductase family protein [Candidatus Dormibacteraeota bacterium]MBO0762599.1 nitroreductase family protein [Candidatus Dormibacteraeota bacterium]
MQFLQVVGDRRTIRWFKTWEPVPRAKVQRILEVARLTTCPGNLQPWRAIVVERDKLDPQIREEMLAADNWQGGHTQAPVWIYWYADPNAARPESFARQTMQLVEVGALPEAYGWNAEHINAAIERGEQTPQGMADIHELIHGLPQAASEAVAAGETIGTCAVAVLAAVNEGLGTALNMIARPSKQNRIKEILGVPEDWIPVWLQLVGYPAEDARAGGQRPRLGFSQLFFEGDAHTPFERDDTVADELRDEGLLQEEAVAENPRRFEELRFLARMYGYPEV